MVPLKEAHISGAAAWPRQRKRAFANDRANLRAVSAAANMSKGAADPADWLPDRGRCRYAEAWVAIKGRYALTMDRAERRAVSRVAAVCR